MKRVRWDLVAVACAAVVLGACESGGPSPPAAASAGATAAAVTRAAITVDYGHDMMTSTNASAYTIGPVAELVVEIGDYRFNARDGGSPRPDAVHVMRGSTGYWRGSVTDKRVTLNAGSLDAVKGGPFAGFETGELYTVSMGVEAPSADGAMRFAPLWMAKVNVAAK
jgi:hypothetical protein